MATKTFKIGLSNTDKQNMAQDVYERLIAMCFDEYDSSETYNEGDFVVYENPADTFKLYKCNSDSVTGAWDSSKWDLATFQDLVDDIEDAVAFVNDKANVDGNYPTMTVGVADQLSPYDDESGDDQDEPFSFQATGTGNGTQPDFSTGAIALMKEKQGNSVVVNQLIANDKRDFSIATTDTSSKNLASGLNIPSGHKVLMTWFQDTTLESNTRNTAFVKDGGTLYYQSATENYHLASGQYFWLYTVISSLTEVNYWSFSPNSNYNIKGFAFIDLTQMFNGDIPQDLLDNPENFFRYYQGSLAYNVGELVNANGRYIKCIGMNQWDEVDEVGALYLGNNYSADNAIRSKNYIRVNPNTQYYLYMGSGNGIYLNFYDSNKNWLGSSTYKGKNTTFITPDNACYLRFYTSGYGATYNNNISINLYYEDEARCLTYEPYEVLTNNDTGTETLRSAGSVKDYKTPDGTITRRVGSYTFTGSESISENLIYNSSTQYRFRIPASVLSGIKPVAEASDKAEITTNTGYDVDTAVQTYTGHDGISIDTSGNIYIYDSANNTSTSASAILSKLAGKTIYYELAEPTTEQGTTFSENLVIDDFGSMDFQGTNGVPQGNLIFYPVDYKAFIDTLYNYTEGTPSELVLKSDLASDKSELQGVDTQLQNAIGGTLRQCLCVKESLDFENTDFVDLGTLSWIYNSTSGHERMVASLSQWKKPATSTAIPNGLTTKLKVVSVDDVYNHIQQGITHESDSNAVFVYTSDMGTDATAFTNAMKGILLAYEKASE